MKLARDRLYYSISDVAEILDLKPSIIRFWETEFAILKPLQKEKNAKRKFKTREIEILLKIKTLLYIEKFTIKGANEQLKNWKPLMTLPELAAALENNVIPITESQFLADEPEKKIKKESFHSELFSDNDHNPQKNAMILIEEIRALLTRII